MHRLTKLSEDVPMTSLGTVLTRLLRSIIFRGNFMRLLPLLITQYVMKQLDNDSTSKQTKVVVINDFARQSLTWRTFSKLIDVLDPEEAMIKIDIYVEGKDEPFKTFKALFIPDVVVIDGKDDDAGDEFERLINIDKMTINKWFKIFKLCNTDVVHAMTMISITVDMVKDDKPVTVNKYMKLRHEEIKL